jgi:hypothetical protein
VCNVLGGLGPWGALLDVEILGSLVVGGVPGGQSFQVWNCFSFYLL